MFSRALRGSRLLQRACRELCFSQGVCASGIEPVSMTPLAANGSLVLKPRTFYPDSSLPTDMKNGARGMVPIHATTVLCVRKENKVVMMADGQVTLGSVILKPNVKKLRRLGENGNVIAGFAGSTADALTLFDRLETKIVEHPGQLIRASVELAKLWRTDKFLRKLDAVMIVADRLTSLTLTGTGDVIESHDGLIGIGSGGSYALAAAKALIDIKDYDAEMIARKAMQIAADTCIYTNHNFTMEIIDS